MMLSPILGQLVKHLLKPTPPTTNEPAPSMVDLIIFDAPPLEESADTLAIAACADASLLVIKAGKEHAPVLRKAQEALARLKAPVMGIIINYQTGRHRPYFYRQRPLPLANTSEPEQESNILQPAQISTHTHTDELQNEPDTRETNKNKDDKEEQPTVSAHVVTPIMQNGTNLGLVRRFQNARVFSNITAHKGKR